MMIYIPFLYFSFLFIFMLLKQKSFNLGSFIVLIYIISSFFSILIKKYDLLNYNFPVIKLEPTFLYCFLLTISILPFYKYRSEKIKFVTLNNNKLFIIICWTLICLTFISLSISLPEITKTFSYDFANIRNEFYRDRDVFVEFSNMPWYQYIINFAPSFSAILLLFFFYSIVYMNNKKIFNILLILSSLVLPLNTLITASRTQTIYWIITFIALYICFKPQMNPKIKKYIRRLFLVIGSMAFIYIMAVTVSRFGERSVGTSGSFINYAGQSFPQFCNLYNKYTFNEITIDRVFPITSKFILKNEFTNAGFRIQEELRIGAPTAVFFTFLGDAMLDFGKFGMIIYTFVYFLISNRFLKRRTNSITTLPQMIILVLLFRQPLLGLFAYVYVSVSSSVMIIGSLIIVFLLQKKIKIN